MTAPRVRVVVVAYNSAAHLPAALDGLRPLCESGLGEITVVDNQSVDGSAEVAAARAFVRVVRAPDNVGFGRGCNLGAEGATTDYVLFLNPDARLEPNGVADLLAFADAHPTVGLLGSAVHLVGGGAQPAFRFPSPLRIVRDALGRVGFAGGDILPIGPGARRVDWVSGAVLLARRTAFEAIAGFDPRFFLYFEETDLCRRAAAIGAETWVLGDVVAMHAAGASAKAVQRPMWEGCIAEHYFQSRFHYLRKHHGAVVAIGTELVELGVILVRSASRWILRRDDHGRARTRLRAPILQSPPRRS